MKPSEKSLPGFESLFSEIISKIPKKRKRGRPQKYNHPRARGDLKSRGELIFGIYAHKQMAGLTTRQQQNHIRAERAARILSKNENQKVAAVFQNYFLRRSTLLAELGLIKDPKLLLGAAAYIAYHGLKGDEARLEIRSIRFGKKGSPRSRWKHFSILHQKIRKAVWQFRNLFPDIKDEEVMADLKKVMGWIPDDLAYWSKHARTREKATPASPKS